MKQGQRQNLALQSSTWASSRSTYPKIGITSEISQRRIYENQFFYHRPNYPFSACVQQCKKVRQGQPVPAKSFHVLRGKTMKAPIRNSKSVGGPCPTCAKNVQARRIRLCSACERYANQDYAPQREIPLPEATLEWLAATRPMIWGSGVSFSDIRTFVRRLREAGLTRQQKRVLWLRFVESLSFTEIAIRAGISRIGAFRLFLRGIKRMRRGLTNPLLVGKSALFLVQPLEGADDLADYPFAPPPPFASTYSL